MSRGRVNCTMLSGHSGERLTNGCDSLIMMKHSWFSDIVCVFLIAGMRTSKQSGQGRSVSSSSTTIFPHPEKGVLNHTNSLFFLKTT